MKDEWGWALGRWNQAYQFALCHNEISPEDMVPGDLIFYEGVYHDGRKRRQHYDITHIEVFLGHGPDGKGTIGSRHAQRVSLHDSWELGIN